MVLVGSAEGLLACRTNAACCRTHSDMKTRYALLQMKSSSSMYLRVS